MGQGTYTILAQTAAEALGIPVENVAVKLGDSALPRAPVAGGSQLANLMTGAVHKAALAARDELIGLAINDPNSPFRDAAGEYARDRRRPHRLAARRRERRCHCRLHAAHRPREGSRRCAIPCRKTCKRKETVTSNFTTIATMLSPTEGDYSLHSWCAHFVEVRVDEDFGTVRVSRVVSALDSGRLYNPKLAESQWKGGIIMGIGQALLEEGIVDERHGTRHQQQSRRLPRPDQCRHPRSSGHLGRHPGPPCFRARRQGGRRTAIVGVAPAIANAVFHATGKRIRDLPITLEKLI